MKIFKRSIQSIIALFICTSIFTNCKKEASSLTSGSQISSTPESEQSLSGAKKLVLQPGPEDGQDSYVYYWAGNPNSVNGNFNSVPELPIERWTQDGYDEAKRVYIKFCGLARIPRTAKIVAAKLQFFGLDGFSLSHPQGNSIYEGSPYNIYPDNSCLVQRVTTPWDANTITWATQPPTTETDQAIIPVSTDQWDYNPKIDVTQIVQTMVAHPAKNYGFKVSLSIDELYRSQVYASCESSDPNRRPKLVVWYK